MNIGASLSSASSLSPSSLQQLKAKQAWESRQAKKTETAPDPIALESAVTVSRSTTLPKAAPAESAIQQQQPRAAAATEVASDTAPTPWDSKVSEIQNIAQRAGFVGVSERDIRQAYTYGESLLADYRV